MRPVRGVFSSQELRQGKARPGEGTHGLERALLLGLDPEPLLLLVLADALLVLLEVRVVRLVLEDVELRPTSGMERAGSARDLARAGGGDRHSHGVAVGRCRRGSGSRTRMRRDERRRRRCLSLAPSSTPRAPLLDSAPQAPAMRWIDGLRAQRNVGRAAWLMRSPSWGARNGRARATRESRSPFEGSEYRST